MGEAQKARVVLAVAALVGGCDSLPPPPPEEPHSAAACGTTVRPLGSPGCPPPPGTAAPPRPPPPSTVLQVEVSGRIVAPAGAPAGRLLLVLMDGPCFQPGSHYLAVTRPGPDGRYQVAAFPPVGTGLEACGVLIEPLRSGSSFWGRAERGTMPVQGRGRMLYEDTDVTLRRGPDVQLPPAIRARG